MGKISLRLHSKQGQAFLSGATEILFGGAAGGGKSHLMRAAAILWCAEIPGLQVYLFRRISSDLMMNHMEGPTAFPAMLAPWLTSKFAKINYSTSSIHFGHGSKIFLCHCQYEKDVIKYQGPEIHVLMMDELTHFTDKIYRFLRGRVRLGGLQIPEKYKGVFPRVLCASNPGGIGHNWVKATFVDFAPPMEIQKAPKDEGGLMRQFIPSLLEDNPTLMENDPDYEDRLEGLGNKELVRAMRRGDWDIVAGGAIDDVWDRTVHVIEPFAIPKGWIVDRSFDWGSSKPFSVGWWAESDGTEAVMKDGTIRNFPKGTMFRITEYYGWNGKPDQGCKMLAVDIAKEIKEREAAMPYHVIDGPADNSIFDAENGVCIAHDMEAKGVKWTRSDKRPGSRINGLEKLRKYLKAALQHPMEDPGLFIFSNCQHFIRTVPVLPRDEKNTDDVDSAVEDHVYDESRYRLMDSRKLLFPWMA